MSSTRPLRVDPSGAAGTVTTVSGVNANGVSFSIANATTAPAITITLGAITPSSVAATGTVTGSNLSGTNTGDQNLAPYALIASPTFTGTPAAPTPAASDNSTTIATTAYVTSAITTATATLGVPKEAKYATTTALTELSYTNNGGVGDILTLVTGVVLIDGQAMTVGDRVLIKNQATASHNGIWTVTTVGLIGVSSVFTRATDFDQATDGIADSLTFVQTGTTLANTRWSCVISGTITWGTTNINFSQFLGGVYTGDESSIHLSGTTFSILSTWAGQSAITILGTIATGVWQGTAIAATYIGAHASAHQSGGGDPIALDTLAAPTDITTLNATTGKHGLLPKLGGGTTNFFRADGTWAAPAGGGGGSYTPPYTFGSM